MTSCTIIISHYESENFLRACVRQIRKHKNENISQHILIIDQSSDECYNRIVEEYGEAEDISIIETLPLYSGFGIDWAIRNANIQTDYICQIHVDVLAINSQWLLLPIKLIEENNFSFVGQLQFICNGTQSIYPPDPFFAMAQCFNVAKTETYREMSLEAGFTRFHNRESAALQFKNNDWTAWAKEDYDARGSDDDVVAFHWEDKYRQHDKLGLAITGFISPQFGRIVEDVVFHFGSCREASGNLGSMPELYQYYTRKINEDYSDELIDEMVSLAKKNRPPEMEILTRNLWNGKVKTHSPPSKELNKRIEELKNA